MEAWSCFLFRCGRKQHVNWTGAKKAVFDSLSKVEGIQQERKATENTKSTQKGRRINPKVLVKHLNLRTKAADPDFRSFFRNNPHLCQYGRGFTYLIGPNPPVDTEISPPPLFSQGSGSPTRVNQPQLAGMSPRPPSPGAQPLASEDGFFPGQAMREGMLAFKFFAPTSDVLIFLLARGQAPLHLHCPDACPLQI